MRTLVLTNSYQPSRIVSWQRAICMLFAEKCEVVESYDEEISSVSLTMKVPSVIRLLRAVRGAKKGIKFSRINIFVRDKHTCQYCLRRLPLSQLTYDHVLPKSRGGKTCWENVVSACKDCNHYKGSRTPEEAGMPLSTKPGRPTSLPISTYLDFDRSSIPDSWATWLYWKGELEQD